MVTVNVMLCTSGELNFVLRKNPSSGVIGKKRKISHSVFLNFFATVYPLFMCV